MVNTPLVKPKFILIPMKFGWTYYAYDRAWIYLNENGTVCLQRGYLQDLFVFPHRRRMGHGEQLVRIAFAKARRLKMETVQIHPLQSTAAKRFWKKKFNINPSGGRFHT